MDNSDTKPGRAGSPDGAPRAPRDEDAIYQGGRVVAHATNPQVDSNAREIRFEELTNSDDLLLPEDCEFREYRILVQRIEDAAKIQKGAAHKGRVLRGVTAEILGYREQ